jgi:hypothetical protein
MPTPCSLCTHPTLLHHVYAFAAESMLLETISPPSHSTIHFIGAISDGNTGDVLKYQHLMKMDNHKHVCAHGFLNELGGLFQGIRNIPGTDTCFFIPKSHIPAHKRPTYGHICCNYQPQKEEKHCIRLTFGGNPIDYPDNKSTPMANLTTAILLINSTISTLGAKFLGIDLTISTSTPPCQTIQKGMYGLPQAVILANQLLEECLATKDYYQCQHTPGLWLWRHVWRNITSCLVIDDFGIKVTNMHNMDNLVDVLNNIRLLQST